VAKAALTTDTVSKAYKKHQVELEAMFGDIIDWLDMRKAGGVPPRMAKNQSEYYEYRYAEVQEAWLARAYVPGGQARRKIVIQPMQIPKAG
jgi:hypothetical protein